jgi:serine/threonine-protein phosphatase PGAM5
MRHGQYEEQTSGALTPLGRKQAAKTADALKRLEVEIVWTSTLLRAEQTAAIVIAKQKRAHLKRTDLLCEVVPTKLPRHVKLRIPVDAARVKDDRRRADQAFAKLFRAARSENTEIVVCHGNLIRYFVCCALGIERKLWMRLDSSHCGLTEFRVLPHGVVRVVRYNDVGHIPLEMRTDASP